MLCALNIHTSNKTHGNPGSNGKKKSGASLKAGALGLQSNFIKFHLFIDNNQWAAEGGRVLALNCEVFIEWTLANINSPQWGQIIRAASYKSVKQEYCLLSRQHPIHTGVDTTQPSHVRWLSNMILLIFRDIREINQDNSYSGNCLWLVLRWLSEARDREILRIVIEDQEKNNEKHVPCSKRAAQH